MDLEELKKQKDKEITGFFWLGLQIAVIFAIPAILASWLGKILTQKTGIENMVLFSLAFSFIFSWIIVFYFYNKKSKKLKKIEDEIKKIKKENNINK